MKKIKNFIAILLLVSAVSCSNDNNIVQKLAQVPAIVREVKGANDLFVFDLQNSNSGLYSQYIVPSAALPADYKQDGLSVLISGDVTNNSVSIDGYISESKGSNITLSGQYNVFDVNSIDNVLFEPLLFDDNINAFFENYLPLCSTTDKPVCFFADIDEKVSKCVMINSMNEFRNIFSCSDDLLPAIDFNSYTLIIGQYYYVPTPGYCVVEQYLINKGTKMELNIRVESPESAYHVIATLYYWGIYPKINNKNISVNIIYNINDR